ncbi:MarR family transcriptional regulator [uncultured Shimia sp.]|uniref:MarR family winged helix-turn-helix transcriptional regulator n=1 Tax=uncultured Shimia sp. TaxID=573152 RepID=UPI0025F334F4|nr:MarR family transcriptional regulator [uncultured Shimia sp.]
MDFRTETSLGYVVNHFARLMARDLEARIKPHGIALGAFPALLHLWEKDGLTQKELVAKLGIEQPTLAATLTRMERDGLVTRQRDAGDGRVQRIRLTDKARVLREMAYAEATAVNARAVSDLTGAEQQQLLELMRRVISTMETTPESG